MDTLSDKRIQTSPDVILISQDLTCNCSWRVVDEPCGSEYMSIIIGIEYTRSERIICRPSLILSNIEWRLFVAKCSVEFYGFPQDANPVETYENIIHTIIDIAKSTNARLKSSKSIINEPQRFGGIIHA